jgi:catechol 2,3-dioxygenase-like lactoylglutathione lyase family enzyme
MDTKKPPVLPPVSQIGVVVRDLAKAVKYYTDTFGIGPFTVVDFAPEKHFVRGKPVPIKLRIGIAQMGAVQIEFIEPVEGDAPHKQFLEERGEGLQHLGFFVNNYDEWMAYLKEQGIGVLMEADTTVEGMGHVRAAYTETDKTGGVLFEFIQFDHA